MAERSTWPAAREPGLLIGEAADLLALTQKAIRVYHQRGLVPEPARDGSGYRRYGPAELVALARIARLRSIGLSLAEMAPLLAAEDGGAALRARLGALSKQLDEEIGEREERRARIAQLLEEGIDDPIAVSAADVWEERSVAMLRDAIPDLTPDQERVERRFSRALAAFLPAQVGEDDAALAAAAAALTAAAPWADWRAPHRRFHALAGAEADDPRVEPLAAELEANLAVVIREAIASLPAPEPDPEAEARMQTAMAAALEVLSPAQRRVLERMLGALAALPDVPG